MLKPIRSSEGIDSFCYDASCSKCPALFCSDGVMSGQIPPKTPDSPLAYSKKPAVKRVPW